MEGWEILRDHNRLGANPPEIKSNVTFRIMQVVQTVDYKLCQSSAAFVLSCTCSLLSLKIMPKKISKEPGDCMQSEEFQGGVKKFTYQGLRSYVWLVALPEVSSTRMERPGKVSLYPNFLTFFPLSPNTFCVILCLFTVLTLCPEVDTAAI